MRNLWLVARREFISRGGSSAYLVSTLLMMVVLLVSTILPSVLMSRSKSEPLSVLLLDRTGQVAAPAAALLRQSQEATERAVVEVIPVSDQSEDALRERILEESRALVIVQGDFPAHVTLRFLGSSPAMLDNSGLILEPLNNIIRTARLQQAGMSETAVGELMRPTDTEIALATSLGGERDADSVSGTLVFAMAISMLVSLVLQINGQFVFQGVLEEKVSRVVEVMASSVGPREMLVGKVLGLGVLGLLQFLLMLVAWAAGDIAAREITNLPAPELAPSTVVITLLFLVFGYLITAAIMAAGAATISRMEDQQAVSAPLSMIIMLPMMAVLVAINNPNSTAAVVLSMTPVFSQSVMIFRVLTTDVPLWQTVTSLAVMGLTAIIVVIAGARIYRAALLTYGARPSLRQVMQFLRAS